jgi:hypothetical protein
LGIDAHRYRLGPSLHAPPHFMHTSSKAPLSTRPVTSSNVQRIFAVDIAVGSSAHLRCNGPLLRSAQRWHLVVVLSCEGRALMVQVPWVRQVAALTLRAASSIQPKNCRFVRCFNGPVRFVRCFNRPVWSASAVFIMCTCLTCCIHVVSLVFALSWHRRVASIQRTVPTRSSTHISL